MSSNNQDIINNYQPPNGEFIVISPIPPSVFIPQYITVEDVIFVIGYFTGLLGAGGLSDLFGFGLEVFNAWVDFWGSIDDSIYYSYIETYIIVYYKSATYFSTAIGARVITKEKSIVRPELTVTSKVSVIPYNLQFIEESCYSKDTNCRDYITHLAISNGKETSTNNYSSSKLAEIRDYAFSNCKNFEGFTDNLGLTIPHGVIKIGVSAFQNCHKIKAINFLNNNSLSIGDYAFQNCTGLTKIIINSNITSIGNSAFQGCSNLRNITINCNSDNIGENAFQGVPSTYTDIITMINNSSGKITKEKLIYLGFNKLAVYMALGSFDLIVDDSNTLISCESDYMNISNA
jgi:hypothetical protein